MSLAQYLPKQTPRHLQGRKRKDGQHGMCTADFTTLERLPQHWKSPKVQTPSCGCMSSLIKTYSSRSLTLISVKSPEHLDNALILFHDLLQGRWQSVAVVVMPCTSRVPLAQTQSDCARQLRPRKQARTGGIPGRHEKLCSQLLPHEPGSVDLNQRENALDCGSSPLSPIPIVQQKEVEW